MLVRHEGLVFKPYRDTVGKLTIGVGRNLDDYGITETEAYYLLFGDIDRAVSAAQRSFAWFGKLDEVRQAVVLSMIFNMGLKGFMGFKRTILAIESGKYELAANCMLESKWASQVGRRARELSKMMLTGEYQEQIP